jgi:hypothetical protein
VTDALSSHPDRVAVLRVLYVALFWPTPWLSAEDILSYGWWFGLRARTTDDVESVLWEMRRDLITAEWQDETPAERGRFMFRITPEGYEELVRHLVMAAPQRRRWWPPWRKRGRR